MTTLEITPKTADKTARFKGTVAAGEHVAVTIKGGASWIGDDAGANLTLRVLDLVTGRTLAVFPRPEETLGEGEVPDAWGSSGDDLTCTLNLNTDRMVAAARHMLRVPVMFVLGDTDSPRTLYFRDRCEVEYWPERIGDDAPYDLDKWPKKIDEWAELVTDWNRRMNAMKLSAQRVPRTGSSVGKVKITLNDGNAATDTVVEVFDGADGEVTPEQLNAAIAGVNASVENVAEDLDAHANNGDIHVTATQKAAWTAKYDKPSSGIPKSDLADAVRASLGKADSAIQEHQSLAAYVNGGVYDGDAKKILLKHDSVTVADIDATVFIKDGMISDVKIIGDNLVITFNADAGKAPVSIPLSRIFNPANFYDKTAADDRFVQKETGKGLVAVDTELSSVSENPVQNRAVKEAMDEKVSKTEVEAGWWSGWTVTCGGIDVTSQVPQPERYASDIVGWSVPTEYPTVMFDGILYDETTGYGDNTLLLEWTSSAGAWSATRRRIVVPTKTSELTNDSGFLTEHQDITGKADKYPFLSPPETVGTLALQDMKCLTYAPASGESLTVAAPSGASGTVRDMVLVLDCTALVDGTDTAPSVVWPAVFHPRTDAAVDFVCAVGARNVYYISEYAAGQYVVGGWRETAGGSV